MNIFNLKELERKKTDLTLKITGISVTAQERSAMEQELYKINKILIINRYITTLSEIEQILKSGSLGLDYRSKCVVANFCLHGIFRYFRGIQVIDHSTLSAMQIENKLAWAKTLFAIDRNIR